jgi:hypothetical protein
MPEFYATDRRAPTLPIGGRDWRLPENRRTAFTRFYSFHLQYRTHPGCVYFWLPAIAEAFDLDEDGLAWLVWLNGNTQNPVTTYLLLEAAPHPSDWELAIKFWNEAFTDLEWDTDRRHQKSRFDVATERWAQFFKDRAPAKWHSVGQLGWEDTWRYAMAHPYMGRLSAWSMLEYAQILFGADVVPDASSLLLGDESGSNSHRNGLATLAGHDAVYWGPKDTPPDLIPELEQLGESLLEEVPGATRLTLESALCTWKSWHKPDRRYPNVYADMAYNRLRRAEARFGRRFDLLWDARAAALPEHLRLECTPTDPGLVPIKQNWYRNTGEVPMMGHDYPDMWSGFDAAVAAGTFGEREL